MRKLHLKGEAGPFDLATSTNNGDRVWIATAQRRDDGKPTAVGGVTLSQADTRTLRDALSEHLGDAVDSWQDKVLQAVKDFPQGCVDQKREFLSTLGIEWEDEVFEVVVRVKASGTDTDRTVEEEIRENFNLGVSLDAELKDAEMDLISISKASWR